MKYKNITYKNKSLKRINYNKVKNIINNCSKYEGLTIYILPVEADPNNEFINGFFELQIENMVYMDSIDYFNYINEVNYYNCNKELGLYLKFYIKEGIK